ncbi:MAG: lytic murein transglycosylase [Woeseiaceae bacterium]|nr:lytic murein transglycosylase [Woeseiaceae bacterium]
MHRTLSIVVLAAALLSQSAARADDDPTAEFTRCIAGLQTRAVQEGIDSAVVENVLGRVERVERVIELDRNQPEFMRTFADYYDRRVTDERVARGRELLEEHRALLDDLQRRYGVPPHYLLSFWGLETNFGSYFGKIRTPDALATLACDPRRGEFFAGELMSALRIVDAGDIDADRMLGSWAGAMGHMQFLPSVFLRYAVDGDGDGRRDLWGSIPDAMASAANFLRGLGWTPGLRWGREVRLPASFDYALTGRGQSRPLAEWVAMGVTDAHGRSMPPLDFPAAVLVPSGHEGPAFIVYENFDTIMRWNRSEYYAIAVGRLADRIAGGAELTRPADTGGEPVPRDAVRQLQEDLNALGFDAGEADGMFGPATSRALRLFQQGRGTIADGYLDAEAIEAVRRAVAERQ